MYLIQGNIEKSRQYSSFELLFNSERRHSTIDLMQNLPKDQVISIIDAYDEMIHQSNPDIITVKECIEYAIKSGEIQTDLYDSSNSYRDLAIHAIDIIESELYELLPEPETNEEVTENDYLSKINGDTYYNLEDRLTGLFRDFHF